METNNENKHNVTPDGRKKEPFDNYFVRKMKEFVTSEKEFFEEQEDAWSAAGPGAAATDGENACEREEGGLNADLRLEDVCEDHWDFDADTNRDDDDDDDPDDEDGEDGNHCHLLDAEVRDLLMSHSKDVGYAGCTYRVPDGPAPRFALRFFCILTDEDGMVDCTQGGSITLDNPGDDYTFSARLAPLPATGTEPKQGYVLLYRKGEPEPMAVWDCQTTGDDLFVLKHDWLPSLEPGAYVWGFAQAKAPEGLNAEETGVVMGEFRVRKAPAQDATVPTPVTLDVTDERDEWTITAGFDTEPGPDQVYTLTLYDESWRVLATSNLFDGQLEVACQLLPYQKRWTVTIRNGKTLTAAFGLEREARYQVTCEPLEGDALRQLEDICAYLEPADPWAHALSRMPGSTRVRQKLVDEAYYLRHCKESDLFHNTLLLAGNDNGYVKVLANAISRQVTGYTKNFVDVDTLAAQLAANGHMDPLFDELQTSSPVCLLHAGTLASPEATRLLDAVVNYLEGDHLCPVMLSDTREALDRLLATHPRLAANFEKELSFETDGITPEEAFAAIGGHVRQLNLDLTYEVQDLLMEYLTAGSGSHRWTKQTMQQFALEKLVKPHLATRKNRKYIDIADVDLPVYEPVQDTFGEAMRELDAMVGLDSLKAELHALFDVLKLSRYRQQQGLAPLTGGVYHCIFTGNPGTGKSTVAALMGRLFKSLGILSNGQVVTVERRTLVGSYIGHTERNVSLLLQQAKGNVLFIDEAYALSGGHDGDDPDFGRHVLQGLLTALSAANSDMVVIMAGYAEDMDRMLARNQGMAGRFPYRFDFVDYTVEELMAIGKQLLEKKQLELEPQAEEGLLDYVRKSLEEKDGTFSNARWMAQLLDNRLLPLMAGRVMKLPAPGREDLSVITAADVDALAGTEPEGTEPQKGKEPADGEEGKRYFFTVNGRNLSSLN